MNDTHPGYYHDERVFRIAVDVTSSPFDATDDVSALITTKRS